eukprot:753605-Amphidinium_carterae.1
MPHCVTHAKQHSKAESAREECEEHKVLLNMGLGCWKWQQHPSMDTTPGGAESVVPKASFSSCETTATWRDAHILYRKQNQNNPRYS